ncbi:MAG: choice-of-anchor I family protein, partial [Pseudomonadota bacterium]
TDGSYKYVGRLVIDFDEKGNIIAESYDSEVSGAYATDDQGVADLNAAGLIDPEVQAIADAIQAQIIATEGNVFGISDVFLNGNRSGDNADPTDPDGVRTQETNLGNLTADANLAAAQDADETVLVSLKNGGGIRANVGEIVVPAGGTEAVRLPNEEILDGDGNVVKPEGGISQNDIQTVLAFNNGLVLMTVTKEELVALLEHGVSAIPEVSGRFPQIAGVEFSYDPSKAVGSRIESASVTGPDGEPINLVVNGNISGDREELFRIVTLDFLAAPRFDEDGNFTGGGDGYPFPNTNTDPSEGEVGPDAARINLVVLEDETSQTGGATFADDGTEQDALAEFLLENHSTEETAFNEEDAGRDTDGRIQNLEFRDDAITLGDLKAPVASGDIAAQTNLVIQAETDPEDEDSPEGGSEVVVFEDGLLVSTNGNLQRVDIFDAETGVQEGFIDLATEFGEDFDGIQSVDIKNGIVAVAISRPNGEGEIFGQTFTTAEPGFIALFDVVTKELLGQVDVGNLPDMLTFNADGTQLLVAGEGEFNEDSIDDGVLPNPLGTVAIVDTTDPAAPVANILDFTQFDGFEAFARDAGIRIQAGENFGNDVEPEYIAISPDGTTAYVALQENNALGIIDLANGEVVNVVGLGTQDYSEVAFDPLDDGNIDIRTFEGVVGFRMPDAIAATEIDGETFVLTANEGDSRDFDEARVFDLFEDGLLDEDFAQQLIADGSLDPENEDFGLGRLEVSSVDGDTDGDGDIDLLHSFNSRSFSIFDAEGGLVFDSGSEFELILADIAPERFNDDDGEDDEDRSDAKGPEPEAVITGEVDGRTYAFIGLERDSGVMIYDISTPADAFFVDYIPGFDDEFGENEGDNVGPETIAFIPAEESSSGVAQIAVAYEITGTIAVYDLFTEGLDINDQENAVVNGTPFDDHITTGALDNTVDGLAGDDKIITGNGNDTAFGGEGEDDIRLGRGDDVAEGGADDDFIRGFFGDDIIDGGEGDDRLFGDAGSDTISGGTGDDLMRGGAGPDTFVFGEDFGLDRIIDFDVTEDLLDFTAVFPDAASIDDLMIRSNARNTTIIDGEGNRVFLAAVPDGELTDDNFVFNQPDALL